MSTSGMAGVEEACCCSGFAGLGQWERAAEDAQLAGMLEEERVVRGDCVGGVALLPDPG